MTVTIHGTKAGTWLPRPWKRLRGRSLSVRVRFELDPAAVGTVAKIVGLTDLSALWRFRRVWKAYHAKRIEFLLDSMRSPGDNPRRRHRQALRYALGHLLDGGHETSDRITAEWTEDGVNLFAYPYRSGSGPSTDGTNLSRFLCTVPADLYNPGWTKWARLSIELCNHAGGTVYVVMRHPDQLEYSDFLGSKFAEGPRRTPLQWLTWSHARGGPGQPGAASPVTYEIEGV